MNVPRTLIGSSPTHSAIWGICKWGAVIVAKKYQKKTTIYMYSMLLLQLGRPRGLSWDWSSILQWKQICSERKPLPQRASTLHREAVLPSGQSTGQGLSRLGFYSSATDLLGELGQVIFPLCASSFLLCKVGIMPLTSFAKQFEIYWWEGLYKS